MRDPPPTGRRKAATPTCFWPPPATAEREVEALWTRAAQRLGARRGGQPVLSTSLRRNSPSAARSPGVRVRQGKGSIWGEMRKKHEGRLATLGSSALAKVRMIVMRMRCRHGVEPDSAE